jgi:protein-tyrosine phosphatase
MERVLDAIEHAQPGSVLFHCVGGRDRTGLVAIVLLAVAGVPPGLIADDYLRGAERAPTHTGLELDRPALRARLIA